MTPDLSVAPAVLLQDPQGVVGPLTFTVELHAACQTVILHLGERHRDERERKRGRERE